MDMWLTPDQQGRVAYDRGDFTFAPTTSRTRCGRASLFTRAGRPYVGCGLRIAALDTAESWYDQTNALMHLGDIEAAIAAYDKARRSARRIGRTPAETSPSPNVFLKMEKDKGAGAAAGPEPESPTVFSSMSKSETRGQGWQESSTCRADVRDVDEGYPGQPRGSYGAQVFHRSGSDETVTKWLPLMVWLLAPSAAFAAEPYRARKRRRGRKDHAKPTGLVDVGCLPCPTSLHHRLEFPCSIFRTPRSRSAERSANVTQTIDGVPIFRNRKAYAIVPRLRGHSRCLNSISAWYIQSMESQLRGAVKMPSVSFTVGAATYIRSNSP